MNVIVNPICVELMLSVKMKYETSHACAKAATLEIHLLAALVRATHNYSLDVSL